MHRLNLLALFLLSLFSVLPAASSRALASETSQTSASTITIGDIKNQTVSFVAGTPGVTAPKSVNTGLFNIEYVDKLNPHDGSMPYFLFAADPCSNCSSERALYLIRPAVSGKPQITPFIYPGKILDPRTHAVMLQSRAFYGHCLAHNRDDLGDDVYVIFQRERVVSHHRHHRRKWSRVRILDSVYVAHASSDFLRDKLVERRRPPLTRTLHLVKRHECHEIAGRNRFLQLHPKGLDWQSIQRDQNQQDSQDQDDSTQDDPGSD